MVLSKKFSKKCLNVILLILMLASFPSGAASKSKVIEKQTWWKVTTTNFSVISDESEEVALELATQLEMFRKTFTLFSRQALPSEMRPVKVISAKSGQAFDVLIGYKYSRFAGMFSERRSGNYAILKGRKLETSTRKLSSIALLFHEYTHYLSANLSIVDLPFWYSEGLADYLSTIRFEGRKKITYGLPIEYHQRSIKYGIWAPMKSLLRGTRGSLPYKQYFRIYPQGWLMVHYFQADPIRQKQMLHYFELLNNDIVDEEAVKKAFGITYLELDRTLKAYAKTRRLPYSLITLNEPWELGEFKAEKLSKADALYEVGEYLLNIHAHKVKGEKIEDEDKNIDKFKVAKHLFKRALELNPSHVNVNVGLAKAFLNEDQDLSQNYINNAKENAKDNSLFHTISGHLNTKLMVAAQSNEERSRYRKLAVSDYNKAIRNNVHNVEAIAGAAQIYAEESRWDKATDLFETALSIAPSNTSLRKDLIRAYFGLGKIELAESEIAIVKRDAHHTSESLADFKEWIEKIKNPGKGIIGNEEG